MSDTLDTTRDVVKRIAEIRRYVAQCVAIHLEWGTNVAWETEQLQFLLAQLDEARETIQHMKNKRDLDLRIIGREDNLL